MKCSIALTTFNGEKFIREQLASIAGQTRHPDQLVVVDDGSSDSTLKILSDFKSSVAFAVDIYQNAVQLGWRENFLKAVNLCSNDIIFFCDQDDIWTSDKIETMLQCFSSARVLLAHHEAHVIDEIGNIKFLMRSGENDLAVTRHLEKPTTWSHAPGFSIAVRKSLLSFNAYWPQSVDRHCTNLRAAHDQWFYHLASNLGDVRFVSKPLAFYRQHANNQVGFVPRQPSLTQSEDEIQRELHASSSLLQRFINILFQALNEQKTDFNQQLTEAIELNRSLLTRINLRRRLYATHSRLGRLRLLADLLITKSYSRATRWSLGYRALLADVSTIFR